MQTIEAQGLEAVWLFPTLGVLYEELLKEDTEAVGALMVGFNRWLREDWGFAHENTIFAAPYRSLADPDLAVRELEWCLDNGARTIVMRPAAVQTAAGPRSPADWTFDPFWTLANDAGITVVIHAGDSGYSTQGYADDGFSSQMAKVTRVSRPSIKAFSIERAAHRSEEHTSELQSQ